MQMSELPFRVCPLGPRPPCCLPQQSFLLRHTESTRPSGELYPADRGAALAVAPSARCNHAKPDKQIETTVSDQHPVLYALQIGKLPLPLPPRPATTVLSAIAAIFAVAAESASLWQTAAALGMPLRDLAAERAA